MTQGDAAVVFEPVYRMRAEFYQEQYENAVKAVIGLRSRLRELDPSLPDVFDGSAWREHEQEWAEWAQSQ